MDARECTGDVEMSVMTDDLEQMPVSSSNTDDTDNISYPDYDIIVMGHNCSDGACCLVVGCILCTVLLFIAFVLGLSLGIHARDE